MEVISKGVELKPDVMPKAKVRCCDGCGYNVQQADLEEAEAG